ncbi:GNAT family N-acetyltransferase [Nocardiopsis mangrovi]|uniref:GNAT family N-acetyltransferase n=1 Tax=Nocardiopsis mangrovi TaxID=1179818 RepID=A0ABV9E3U3_9ACTN
MAPVPADPADAPALAALRDQAARWQLDRGIEQWRPGEVPAAAFADQARAGELFVLRDPAGLVGAVRVVWADPGIWGDPAAVGPAGYVHGLMVARSHTGRGIGAGLLDWAERRVRAAGRDTVRLDCVAGNRPLRRYYRDRGYREVGRATFPGGELLPCTLFEKALGPP